MEWRVGGSPMLFVLAVVETSFIENPKQEHLRRTIFESKYQKDKKWFVGLWSLVSSGPDQSCFIIVKKC